MPILGVGGEIAAGGFMQALGQLGSDVDTAIIERAGHWLAEEQPEALNALLVDFLKK